MINNSNENLPSNELQEDGIRYIKSIISEIRDKDPSNIPNYITDEVIQERLSNLHIFTDKSQLFEYLLKNVSQDEAEYMEKSLKRRKGVATGYSYKNDEEKTIREYVLYAENNYMMLHEAQHMAEMIVEYIPFDQESEKIPKLKDREKIATAICLTSFAGVLASTSPEMLHYHLNFMNIFLSAILTKSYYQATKYLYSGIELRARKRSWRGINE